MLVEDGLVNSAQGIVTGFIPAVDPNDLTNTVINPQYVLIKFDNNKIGQTTRESLKGITTDQQTTPIAKYEDKVRLGRSQKVSFKRWQFPIALAWGVTIHKEQGRTETAVAVVCKGNFQPGQFYTAISRPQI